jgi:hypothetical protein
VTPEKETLVQLLDRIEQNTDSIYVRAEVDGHVGTYALCELPSRTALYHVFRWIRKHIEENGLTA